MHAGTANSARWYSKTISPRVVTVTIVTDQSEPSGAHGYLFQREGVGAGENHHRVVHGVLLFLSELVYLRLHGVHLQREGKNIIQRIFLNIYTIHIHVM